MDDLVTDLLACVDDPMWATHAEVSKSVLRQAADRITALEAENARLRGAIQTIRNEAERESGNWTHLKRCIAVQARQALERPCRLTLPRSCVYLNA